MGEIGERVKGKGESYAGGNFYLKLGICSIGSI